jgi:pimeloyl-ACP methyl ester carboxylesterase
MSLGGLTLIRLAATRPELVRRAVIVDVTPGSGAAHAQMSAAERGTTQLISGARTFASLQEMVELAVQASPRRPASAVRRGVRHNARQQPDGTWTWRYDVRNAPANRQAGFGSLWDDLPGLSMPVMLVRGGDSSFVTPDDLAEVTRQLPALRVEMVPGAGHAVQSDQPLALTGLISEFLFTS